MSNITFKEGNNFRTENINSAVSSNENIILQNQNPNMDNENLENEKPRLNNFSIDENRRVKIKPVLSRNTENFDLLKNSKRSNNSIDENFEESDDEEDDIDLSDDNIEEMNEEDDDIDNNNSLPNFNSSQFNNHSFSSNQENFEDEDDQSIENGEEISSDEEEQQQNAHFNSEKKEEKKTDEFPDFAPQDYSERNRYKQELLIKLLRLDKAGFNPSKRFTMAST